MMYPKRHLARVGYFNGLRVYVKLARGRRADRGRKIEVWFPKT